MQKMSARKMEMAILLVGLFSRYADAACCPNGWTAFRESCYYFTYDSSLSCTEADMFCRNNHDSHLVHVNDATENAFIKDFLTRLDGANYWMGLTDELIEGVYMWSDTDTEATFTDWSPSQPYGAGQDCVAFWEAHGHQWDDWEGSNSAEAVCEMEVDSASLVG